MLELVRKLSGFSFALLILLIFLGGMAVSSVLHKEVFEKAIPQPVWQCGNHNPPHVAFTTDEALKATKECDCKLWHQVKR